MFYIQEVICTGNNMNHRPSYTPHAGSTDEHRKYVHTSYTMKCDTGRTDRQFHLRNHDEAQSTSKLGCKRSV